MSRKKAAKAARQALRESRQTNKTVPLDKATVKKSDEEEKQMRIDNERVEILFDEKRTNIEKVQLLFPHFLPKEHVKDKIPEIEDIRSEAIELFALTLCRVALLYPKNTAVSLKEYESFEQLKISGLKWFAPIKSMCDKIVHEENSVVEARSLLIEFKLEVSDVLDSIAEFVNKRVKGVFKNDERGEEPYTANGRTLPRMFTLMRIQPCYGCED